MWIFGHLRAAGVVVLCAWAVVTAAMVDAMAAEAEAQDLVLRHVMLSTGGVGYFEYEATVDGEAALALAVRLDQVDELWQLFQTAILGTITTEEVTAAQVTRMASLNLPLLAATERALEAYERLAIKNAKGGLFSLLGKAVTAAQTQRMLSQKILKEYLLVGFGHQADRNTKGLQRSIAEFDRVLKGLREGDIGPDLGGGF